MPAGAGDTRPTDGDILPSAGDTRAGVTAATIPHTGEVITTAGMTGTMEVEDIITRLLMHITVITEVEGAILTATGNRVRDIPLMGIALRIPRRRIQLLEPTGGPVELLQAVLPQRPPVPAQALPVLIQPGAMQPLRPPAHRVPLHAAACRALRGMPLSEPGSSQPPIPGQAPAKMHSASIILLRGPGQALRDIPQVAIIRAGIQRPQGRVTHRRTPNRGRLTNQAIIQLHHEAARRRNPPRNAQLTHSREVPRLIAQAQHLQGQAALTGPLPAGLRAVLHAHPDQV